VKNVLKSLLSVKRGGNLKPQALGKDEGVPRRGDHIKIKINLKGKKKEKGRGRDAQKATEKNRI